MDENIETASKTVQSARMAICTPCEQRAGGVCSACDCVISLKVRRIENDCPKGLWFRANLADEGRNDG